MEKLYELDGGFPSINGVLSSLEKKIHSRQKGSFSKAKSGLFLASSVAHLPVSLATFMHAFSYLNIIIRYKEGHSYVVPTTDAFSSEGKSIGKIIVQNGKTYNASCILDIKNHNGELIAWHGLGFRTTFNMKDFSIKEQIFTK